jgi:hypothetical protein
MMSSVVTFDCVDAYYSGVARGRSDERERIIELIETTITENGKDSWLDVIELIKGEQND